MWAVYTANEIHGPIGTLSSPLNSHLCKHTLGFRENISLIAFLGCTCKYLGFGSRQLSQTPSAGQSACHPPDHPLCSGPILCSLFAVSLAIAIFGTDDFHHCRLIVFIIGDGHFHQ